MSDARPASLFDIIGPVMVGPSSSHTAGAVRLGQIARAILGTQPERVLIELHGSFALTGKGHGTDRAVVAGLLGFSTADDRIRDSLALARQAGMEVRFATCDLGPGAHPNALRMTMEAGATQCSMTGASVGGGLVLITTVDDYEVDFSGAYHTLLIVSQDRPGTINAVTNWLAAHQINVAFLSVGRKERGGDSIMLIETDDPVPAAVTKGLATFPWVRWVRYVPRITDA